MKLHCYYFQTCGGGRCPFTSFSGEFWLSPKGKKKKKKSYKFGGFFSGVFRGIQWKGERQEKTQCVPVKERSSRRRWSSRFGSQFCPSLVSPLSPAHTNGTKMICSSTRGLGRLWIQGYSRFSPPHKPPGHTPPAPARSQRLCSPQREPGHQTRRSSLSWKWKERMKNTWSSGKSPLSCSEGNFWAGFLYLSRQDESTL